MIKVCSLKVGRAGDDIKPRTIAFVNVFNPAKLCA